MTPECPRCSALDQRLAECRDCGRTVIAAVTGPLPHRCPGCRRRHRAAGERSRYHAAASLDAARTATAEWRASRGL